MKYMMADGDYRSPEELCDDDLVDNLYRESTTDYYSSKASDLKKETLRRLSGELKLFVWEGVLCDYSCGAMFALAPDVETARQMLTEKLNKWNICELNAEPDVYTKPFCLAIHGGE